MFDKKALNVPMSFAYPVLIATADDNNEVHHEVAEELFRDVVRADGVLEGQEELVVALDGPLALQVLVSWARDLRAARAKRIHLTLLG